MTKALAGVFDAPGKIGLRSFPLPRLLEGEILVRVRMCTICGSDLHTYTGRRSVSSPMILGHEIIGVVERVVGEVRAFGPERPVVRVGDRVVWSLCHSCGTCDRCSKGIPQKCHHLMKFGHHPIESSHPLMGGLSTYCHLPAGTAIFQVPAEIPDEVACPASCATATVVASVTRAGVRKGESVLVQGMGMLGVTAVGLLRQEGLERVIACDTDPTRLEQAKRFGATSIIRADQPVRSFRDEVLALTDGHGMDVILEMSGCPSAIESGMELLGTGGRYVWVGGVFPTVPGSIVPETVIRKHAAIFGVHNYDPHSLWTALVFLGTSGARLPFGELVSARFPLEQISEAFRYALEHKPFRVAVTMP
ncbi:MAG: zinc-binding dehydrogenase [Gemmataceae bacterium]